MVGVSRPSKDFQLRDLGQSRGEAQSLRLGVIQLGVYPQGWFWTLWGKFPWRWTLAYAEALNL